MENYDLLSQIGEGSFGQVFKAKKRANDEIVAVKRIRKRGRSCKELKSLRQECEIQRYLSHPNIVRMIDSFETVDEIVVVTEYADKELYEILGKTGRFTEDRAQKVICDLVSALYYLHSNRVLHRDLKPQNVLLEANGTAKLCDFGFARIMSTRTHVLTSIKGTPLYMAPELIEEYPYDHNADLWSLGCIAYEMIVGTPPFQTTSILHLVGLIRFESIKWPEFISANCQSFLQGLLEKIPSQRLTWPDLLEHPFVKNRILIIDSPASFTAPLSSSEAHAKQLQFEHLSMRAINKSRTLDNNHQGCVSQPIYPLVNRFHPFVSADAYNSRQNGTSSGSTASVDVLLSNLSLRASLQSDLLSANQAAEINCTDSACMSQQLGNENINSLYDFTGYEKLDFDNKKSETSDQSPKKLPDWDARAVDQHIENDEWLAFLQQSIEEIIEGEITSLVEENCVSIFVSPLRNSSASSQVIEYIACLLSLPFVCSISPEELTRIQRVYYDVKVVPNLVCAMNIILERLQATQTEDHEELTRRDCGSIKTASMLSPEQLQALESSMLVLCRLVHSDQKFLDQFCQAVDIIGVNLLREMMTLERRKVRIVADLLAILNNTLRSLPGNVELVEKVVFGQRSETIEQLSKLLTHRQVVLKSRTCTLLRLLGRLRSKAFKQIWDRQLESLLRNLTNDEDNNVKNGNSDESDYEETEVIKNRAQGRVKVTLKLIEKWQEDIQTDKSMQTMKCIVEAFHAALLTVADPEESKNVEYKVEGSAAFNGVVQLCVMNLPTAFKKFLKMTNESKFEAHKYKRFGKVKGILKQYLKDLLQILENVTSTDVQVVLLKYLHQMICFTGSFSSLNKPLLRILLRFWSSGEETVRIVAYLSIIQMATSRKESILDNLFRTMYIKYVENSKFVSPNSMPGINFMRLSLAEIYMLDQNLAYNHAFLYIRQLAIHLRNALTLKKKELFQAVYNWQYINSLRFWCQIMSLSKNGSMLRSLLYPLVQIIIGTIKLIPTEKYYPLRFHCCQMLINLSKETGTFIPVLPFLLDVLNTYDFNKKHQRSQMKHMSFMCLLRASKIQLKDSNFKNAIVEDIYQLISEHAANESHSIYFPDLYVPCTIQMKAFLKKCKVANFCKKIKQLLDKIQENRQFVETERNKVVINLSDLNAIKNFENQLKVGKRIFR